MALSFFRAFGRQKVISLQGSLREMAVKADIQAASAAQLDMYDSKLADLSSKSASALRDYQREQKEADDARNTYNQHVSAVTDLQSRVASETDEAQKTSLQASLETLLTETERLRSVAEKEIQEANDAKALFDEYTQARDILGQKLRDARQKLKEASANITKGQIAEERSKDMLAAQQEKAGLVTNNSDLDIVLSTMNKIASSSQARAAANQMHTDALKEPEVPKDANIEAALARASGKSVSDGSVSDRIAGLAKL